MAVTLSNLEADIKEEHPNSQKVLLEFIEEHKQRVIQIRQVQGLQSLS